MADDKSAAVAEKEEETTSQDSSPQSKEAITEPETRQEGVAPQETPDEVSDEISDVDSGEGYSEPTGMTEEQRKAFQEQRLEIKKLKEEKEKRAKGENAFNAFRPQSQSGVPDINSFVDTETGNVDWAGYNRAVINQATAVAQQTVNEQLDENNARQKFPEVFADPDLEEAVAGQWFANKFKGKDVSISDLAERFSRKLSKATTKAEKEGAKKALTELTPKEQASLTVQSQSDGAKTQATVEEEETLKYQTRYGNDDALAKLMGKVAWRK